MFSSIGALNAKFTNAQRVAENLPIVNGRMPFVALSPNGMALF